MAENIVKGIDVKVIGEMSSQISTLKKELSSLGNVFEEVKNGNKSFFDGLTEAIPTVISSYDKVSNLFSTLKNAGKNFEETLNKKVFKEFSEEIGIGAMFAGEGLKDYKKTFGDFVKNLKKLPEKAIDSFGSVKDQIVKCGEKTKESFGKIKEAITEFSFSDLKDKVKALPDMFDSGIKGAGDKLYKNAESVGKGAGKLLSVGLTGGIALAAVAIAGLVASFMHLMDSNKAFKEEVTEAWDKVKEAFQPAIDAFNEFKDTMFGAAEGEEFSPFVNMILNGVTTILGFVAEAASVIANCISGLLENVSAFWNAHGESICAKIEEMWGYISDIVSGARDFISGIIDIIVGIFTLNGEKIKEGMGKLWDGITELFSAGVGYIKSIFESIVGVVSKVFSGVVSYFDGLWGKIKKIFTTIGTKVGNAIGGAFKGAINGVISFAQRTINGFIRNINSVIGLINKIPGVSIGRISTVSLPRLASGGLVDAGQMFIARERGPEFVGTFGSRTAVMNNSQIVDAVSKGVYAAVKSAMGGEGSFTFNIMNQLDGKAIGEQVIKYHNGIVRQTGSSPLYV